MAEHEGELTTPQLARALGVSARTVIRWQERGWIKAERVFPSGHRRWLLSKVQAQLAEHEERGAAD
jgi:excisionase family DNA binding protein